MTQWAQATGGPISIGDLGFTLMHEHVAIFSPSVRDAYPFLFDMDEILANSVDDLRGAKEAGIGTIVDVTTPDLGRDPRLVAEAAAAAGINVILCTGIWLDVPRYFHIRSADHAAELFVREIQVGIADTDVRAGIIKVASNEEVTAPQEIILRGAARAARATGAAVSTHTLASARTGLRQLDILEEEGLDSARVIIGHSTDGAPDYLRGLYARGCTVGWDQFGTTEVGDEDDAITNLISFVKEGRSATTVLSQDGGSFVDWDASAHPGHTYVPDVVLPRLREAGISTSDIDKMTKEAPARLLAMAPSR
jgi:phosphotriesterase-related protein